MGLSSAKETLNGKTYSITTFDRIQKYNCTCCNNPIKSDTVIFDDDSNMICEECFKFVRVTKSSKSDIPKTPQIDKDIIVKVNPEDIERIENRRLGSKSYKVYHYKDGILSHCDRCGRNYRKMVEFEKDGEKHWTCSKCYNDFITGRYKKVSDVDNATYKKIEERIYEGLNYKICTYKENSSFFCEFCGHSRKRIVEFPTLNGIRKICYNCFKNRIQKINYSPKGKSEEQFINRIERALFANSKIVDTNGYIDKPEVPVSDVIPEGTTIYKGTSGKHECVEDDCGTLIEFRAALYDNNGKSVEFNLKKCPKCGKIFIRGNKYDKWRGKLNKYNVVTKNQLLLEKHVIHTDISDQYKNEESIIKEIPQLPKEYFIGARDFVTRVNVFHCANKNHNLIDVKAKVNVLQKDGHVYEVTIPAALLMCDKEVTEV